MGARPVEPAPLHLQLEAAESSRRAGNLAEARQRFTAIAAAAERTGDASALVAAGLGVGGLWVHEHRDVIGGASVRALWQRALDVAPVGSLEHARLVAREAAEAAYENGPVDEVAAAVEAVGAFGDDRATAEAISLLHHVQLGPGYAGPRLALAEQIIRLAAGSGDDLLAIIGLCWRTVDLFLLGDPRSQQSLTELRQRSTLARCEAVGFIADVLGAMVLARAGSLGPAESAATAAFERGVAAGDPDAPAYYGALIATLRWWQGRAADVVDMVRSLAVSPQLGRNDHVYVAADGMLSASLGDLDSAEEALARLGSVGLGRLPDSSSWLTTQFLVVETAYVLGDAAAATDSARLLRPYRSLPVMPSLAVVCLGSSERALGLAAATAGRFSDAVDHLDVALRADRRLGSRPMATLTSHTLAGILSARGKPGDEARSDQLTRRAEDQARRMAMQLPRHPTWLCGERATTSAHRRHASLERISTGWKIGVDGRATVVPDRIGFTHLARLVARPDQDLDAMTLASAVAMSPGADPQPILDAPARRDYRRRTRDLERMLERADLRPAEAHRCRRELVQLTATLRSASGLAGRPRAFPTDRERARTAVRKAVVRALATVATVEPDLGAHLQQCVVTGASCRYRSDTTWSIRVHP